MQDSEDLACAQTHTCKSLITYILLKLMIKAASYGQKHLSRYFSTGL